jgi:site-specific recombinase XerD
MDPLFEAYLAALRRRCRSPLTLQANLSALQRLDRSLDQHATEAPRLSLLACEHYFETLLAEYAVSTVRRHLAVVRAAYRYGLRHQLVDRDPTADVKLPRLPDVEPATYSNEQLRAILAAVRNEREQLLVYLFAFAGLRLCELVALTWEQVDLDHQQLKLIGKSGKFRLVPLHPALEQVLREHRAATPFGVRQPVVSPDGRPLAHRTGVATVRTLVRRAGIETANPSHAFRRTVATVMHEQGVRTAVIDRIMGWAPRTVRDRHYLRIAPAAMRDAILTLYRDDPICTTQLKPDTPAPVRTRPALHRFLARETARLEQLERELDLALLNEER